MPFRIPINQIPQPEYDLIHFIQTKLLPMQKRSPKVLLVDDNDLMRTLLRGILRSESCQVIGEAKTD